MKIDEYMGFINNVEHIERKYYVPPPPSPPPQNLKLITGIDVFGNYTEYRVNIIYKKLPLGTGNLREHANPNFDIEQKIITNEKRRLGLS
jgi:hypothetical protein